jgi:integrase
VFATEVGSWTRPEILNRALAALVRWSDPAQWEKRWRAANWAAHDHLESLGAIVRSGERLPNVTLHDLRHTYATLALRRGTPLEIVSRTLRHARISITMDIYRHVLERKRRRWISSMRPRRSGGRN